MKILKNPMANAFYFALTTAIYAAVFFIASEFISSHPLLTPSNPWSHFLAQGHLTYVGLGMIGTTVVIDLFSALRRKTYDEYQVSLLEKNLLINGGLTVVLFPVAACSLILFPSHSLEFVLACMLFQWLVMAALAIIYFIKNNELTRVGGN